MTTLHGVDFSGGKKSRGKIWVSTWDGESPATTTSGFSHAGLVHAIASAEGERRHAWLIDAPFSLPARQLEAHSIDASWPALVEWLASFEDAREWRRACRAVSRKEPKRDVDQRFSAPLAPMNLRIFKQTWHCIVDVLALLASTDGVAVLPMALAVEAGVERVRDARAWVGEGCPSSTLARLDWPRRGYKGPGEGNRALRESLVRRLETEESVPIDGRAARSAIDDAEGDALDSLLLLPAVKRFSEWDHAAIIAEDAAAAVEGWIYA